MKLNREHRDAPETGSESQEKKKASHTGCHDEKKLVETKEEGLMAPQRLKGWVKLSRLTLQAFCAQKTVFAMST